MADHHYFGTTAFDFVKKATRKELLEHLARRAGKDLIKEQTKLHGGLYSWMCRVNAPIEQPYGINDYRPVGVEITEGMHFRITCASGAGFPIEDF